MRRRSAGRAPGATRERLLRFVSTHPATHKAKLARHLRIGWSTLQHHARLLVRERRIREVEYRGRRFLVPTDVAPSRIARAVVLAVAEHARVLGLLVSTRQERIQDLARRLRWSRKVVRRCLYSLLQAGLVEKSGDYHPHFRATARGRSELRRARSNT